MRESLQIIKRLYKSYTAKHYKKIIWAVFFSILVAGSTSSIAYLLDPAIEKIFIDQDVKLMYLIPIVIVVAFFCKGMSLYLAKVLMIHVSQELKADVQKDMMRSLISTDTKFIDKMHTGKFVSNLTLDVTLLVNLISTALLNIFKDTLGQEMSTNVIFSCGSGITASVLALAYSLINNKYMPIIYDGSWAEYGKI